jgi:hypothetical protein
MMERAIRFWLNEGRWVTNGNAVSKSRNREINMKFVLVILLVYLHDCEIHHYNFTLIFSAKTKNIY